MIKSQALPFLNQIPKDIRLFLTKALILFIAWKLLYHLLLFPTRIPDKHLTRITAEGSVFLYHNIMGIKLAQVRDMVSAEGNPFVGVYNSNQKLVAIADSCNGLELIVLYVGFLCCFPIKIKRLMAYVIIGTISIVILNMFRCYGLTWMYLNDYYLADFFHKYIFKMAIYGLIFLTWVKYSKRYLHV